MDSLAWFGRVGLVKTTRRQARPAARPASGRNWLAIGGFVALVIAAATWMYVQDQRSKRQAMRDLNDSMRRTSAEEERSLTPEQREARRREIEQYKREYEARENQ